MPMFPPTENLEEKMKYASFDEARAAVRCAREEHEKKQEMEQLEARPAYIKAEEEILRLIDNEVCDCQDVWELRQGIEKIFRSHFGHT